MTCKDIMTSNPACCIPSDSVSMAAQIMKREDVGPVLVVSDHNEKRLVGILTDRDLAVKVIAANRDAQRTRVDEVMTLSPVCCREDESTGRALQLMANHQVRRIPIVDHDNRLTGIVAQADVALHEDEKEVGRVVEHISEPYGSAGWTEGARQRMRGASSGSLTAGAVCLGIGAGLMYLFDPSRGSARRHRLQEGGASWCATSADAATSKAADLKNRATGVVASAKARLRHEEDVPDQKLESRIRSRMGRHVSNSHSIQVESNHGAVTLRGPILAGEVRRLLDCVNGTPGVRSVDSRLDVFETPGAHPGLQEAGRRSPEHAETGSWNTASSWVLAGIAGGGLVMYGLRSKAGHFDHQEEPERVLSGAQGY